MNTKKLRKALLLVLALAAVCITSVFGTLAYLKASKSVSNTFSVGNISMALDETNTDPTRPGERTDEGNNYNLIPGKTYTKDPTVTINSGSESCYVRVIVTVSGASAFEDAFGVAAGQLALSDISKDIDTTNWIFAGKTALTTSDTVKFEYRYKDVVSAGSADAKLPEVFKTITVPGTATSAKLAALANASINVEAHAMQSDGFSTADAAWTAFESTT